MSSFNQQGMAPVAKVVNEAVAEKLSRSLVHGENLRLKNELMRVNAHCKNLEVYIAKSDLENDMLHLWRVGLGLLVVAMFLFTLWEAAHG